MTKNVLITGGSRGIGLGIARALAKGSCNLAINGVREAKNVALALKELQGLGAKKVIYCQGNIAVPKEREKIVTEVLEAFGQLHVLVNNAGVGPLKRLDVLETTEESYDRVMDINLKGPFFLTQKVADHMIQYKEKNTENVPCIINISSISATTASISRGEYCLSKAGLSMMTQLFATKLGEYGIPVYEVRPGVIETDMTAKVLQKYQEMINKGLMLQSRIGSPEDVGKAVSALVEGKFPYSTGQVIMVDGGLTIPRL